MADKENKRKCFKCACSPADHGVKLFRFPKPAGHKEPASVEVSEMTGIPLVELGSPLQSITPVVIEPQAGPSHESLPFKEILIIVTTIDSQIGPNTVLPSKPHGIKTEKERLLYNKCRKYMRQTSQLRNRIKNLKKRRILELIEENKYVQKLSKKITPAFALLLQGQIRNSKRKVTGCRWLKDEKLTSLRIYKRSPTCYRLLRTMFRLPSPRTLSNLLNKVPFGVGIHKPVLNVLKEFVQWQKPEDNNFILMFDEMSLKKHNSNEDHIEGCQDHGTQGRSSLIAGYALVFMLAGIRKRVKQPIAHYFSSGFSTADRLAVIIKEVLDQCFNIGVNIVAMVCDMDGVNRHAMAILGASSCAPTIKVHDKEIVTFFDQPHLLKCFRNLFMKYNIEIPVNISSENRIGRGVAKWSYIRDFYELDSKNPNYVYAPVLRKEHFKPNNKQKMKVNLAAQVLSHSVAGGMYAMISRGMLPADAIVTADLVNEMDRLLDTLNSDSVNLQRGKPFATNLTHTSVHLKFIAKIKRFSKILNMWEAHVHLLQMKVGYGH